ncbi:MAG: type I-U CRISPR-associated protein Cas7 [Gammaproteobacteria bacterium]|nr:type I-U CRISPR-associated protein Cas7 [Gammaproteobacteria bacterium]MYF58629.1 type I-U CRISPR-associated protein Cas7 [Gammaproteobacteria bacterium]MYF69177.1 type I-U CRISPR-associated protein Cas7 [Pseudomonadota bacterium]
MPLDLTPLNNAKRLLFKIPLIPLQGSRFQPTGFPSLGAATFQTGNGGSLLVESAQSMANHLEMTIWDNAKNDVKEAFKDLSHVRITRNGKFLTDTILESHRVNSPYLLTSSDRTFLDAFLKTLRQELGKDTVDKNEGLVDRQGLARAILRFDCGSLIHGCFLSNNKVKLSEQATKGVALAGGRLRVARALSAFIEADDVHVAPSGGVKNDHVNPSGVSEDGFGNIPFARDEYTAASITLYVNLDLAQIRGYGLENAAERLLILLSLYKLRALTTEGMRLRTACDLCVEREEIEATIPRGWCLPALDDLEEAVKTAIAACKEADKMVVTCATFEDELKKGKVADVTPVEDAGEAVEEDT